MTAPAWDGSTGWWDMSRDGYTCSFRWGPRGHRLAMIDEEPRRAASGQRLFLARVWNKSEFMADGPAAAADTFLSEDAALEWADRELEGPPPGRSNPLFGAGAIRKYGV